ncbi:calmodulin-binding protein 60 G isoform X3 [Beta vulgaris subsp. vulgaris]|uniref:calmodulin-binding protein 60 G isoform X3 n=1 Tax=Beta vulgaris subsp. vulgaris TaxID=3555 RepID=UPI002036B684|nr:calmodulin-binding protein 60 G isoform X3 [Beta vulgaris subsp. vulgaris]
MVFKRNNSGEKENNDNQQPPSSQQRNQRLKYTRCVSKDRICRLQSCSTQLETLIRKVVREEVEQVIQQSHHSISRSLSIDAKPCELRKFKLQFEGKLPQKLFTGNKIEAEGSAAIKLFLLDAVTGHRVTDGPLSSTKVKIVALHGHFRAEELDIWTKKEFSKNIVSERDGKRPLLVGQNVVIFLENGVGCVGDVCFTDNSSWERSKMFRLGAKVEAKEDHVMEAVSTPFEVKDRRGENYQKHNIPSLEDEVWRLCWIAKDGKICERLAEHQIYKVKDFLTVYYLNESVLRQILKVSPKKWEAIIQQATSCFSGNTSRILCHSVSSPNDMPDCINPGLNQQQFCLPTTSNGTIAVMMPTFLLGMSLSYHLSSTLTPQIGALLLSQKAMTIVLV